MFSETIYPVFINGLCKPIRTVQGRFGLYDYANAQIFINHTALYSYGNIGVA